MKATVVQERHWQAPYDWCLTTDYSYGGRVSLWSFSQSTVWENRALTDSFHTSDEFAASIGPMHCLGCSDNCATEAPDSFALFL